MSDSEHIEFLQNIAQALIAGEPDDAQDRFVDIINEHAEDNAVAESVMDLIDQLEGVRRKIAFDAVVAVILNTSRASVMHRKGLEKWDTLIERIAVKDIFSALDWAALPCLWSDEFGSLHAAGLKKWQELLERAGDQDFNHALHHARIMEDSDPTRPFATVAKQAADLLENKSSQKGTPPPPSPTI